MLKYMPFRKSKDKSSNENESTLKEADEEFLERIASEGAPPPLPTRPTIILDNGTKVKGKDAQVALMDGADKVPLPSSPPEVQEGGDDKKKEQRNYWSYMPTIPRTTADWAPYIPSVRTRHSDKDKETAGADLASAAESMKTGQQPEASEDEEKKERDDLSSVLDQLNMSATTTRTFSLSKESQKLMEDFTQILKDIVNGVPTAYDDLEKLLTTRNKEISHMFKNMPPWLQTLVKSLPAKLGSTMAPELMAAASEKPGADGKARLDPNIKVGTSEASVPTGKKKSKKSQIPTLKSLLATDGAVAGMLRSILNFLKLRFPMFVTGTNILMSVAVFLLLFVFWYCHKRGREVRLENERLSASQASLDEEGDGELSAEGTDVEDSNVLEKDDGDALPTSTNHSTPPILDQADPKDVPLPGDKAQA